MANYYCNLHIYYKAINNTNDKHFEYIIYYLGSTTAITLKH